MATDSVTGARICAMITSCTGMTIISFVTESIALITPDTFIVTTSILIVVIQSAIITTCVRFPGPVKSSGVVGVT